MQKLINLENIKIEHKSLLNIQTFCANNKLEASDLFIYLNEENKVNIGFTGHKDKHLVLPDYAWLPVNNDVTKKLN
jgi:hypothetical protein